MGNPLTPVAQARREVTALTPRTDPALQIGLAMAHGNAKPARVQKGGRLEGQGFWFAATIAAMLVGLSKGGLPVVGMLAVPVLSLTISPVAAAGLLLPVYVVSDVFGVYAYRHAFDRRVLMILAPAAILGIGLGWLTAANVPEALVGGIVGLIGLCYSLILLFGRPSHAVGRKPRIAPGLVWGALAGYTSFVSHSGAPPYQVYVMPLGLDKATYAGTTTFFFAFVNAVKLIPYFALGQLSPGNLSVAAWLFIPAVLSVLLGYWLVRIIPQALFFRLVTYALLGISARLVWQALMQIG